MARALHFTASTAPEAQASLAEMRARYGDAGDAAEIVVALGGDGFMLQTLHAHVGRGKPIYGMNRGSVGFLMNEFHEDGLLERLKAAEEAQVHPLRMRATAASGTREALAFNEVSLLRQDAQAAKLRVIVDDKVRIPELICDGALISTPGGLHRLQPVGARPDPAHRRGAAGAGRRSAPSAPGAGAGRCCRTAHEPASRSWRRRSAPSAPWPTIWRCATSPPWTSPRTAASP